MSYLIQERSDVVRRGRHNEISDFVVKWQFRTAQKLWFLGGIFVPSTRYSIRLRSNSNRWSIPRDIPDASRRRSTQVLIDPFKLAGKAWNEFLLGENSAASESFWLVIDQRALKISVWNRIRISLRLFFFQCSKRPILRFFRIVARRKLEWAQN